jgi:hypothetical protein
MKRMWLLITMLLLTACGGGGGTGGGVTDVQPGSQKGSVVVNIKDSVAQALALGPKRAALAPAALNCRLVISNPNLRVNGLPLKVIVDGAIPISRQITGLTFPVANGYTFELVTYYPDTVKPAGIVAVNRLLQNAKTANINITAGATVAVDLFLQTIKANLTLPSPVYSGAAIGVTSSFQSQPTPLQPNYRLVQATFSSAVKHAVHPSGTISVSHATDKSPIVLAPGTLYVQGEFYMNTSLLDLTGTGTILDASNTANMVAHTKESNAIWTFNYPNPDFGDNINLAEAVLATVGVPVTIPVGDSNPPAPTVATFTLPVSTNSSAVSGIIFTANPDPYSPLNYLITESATTPLVNAPGWTTSAPSSYTIVGAPTPGSPVSLYAWLKDGYGQVSTSSTASVIYDTTAPTVTVFSTPPTASSATVSGITVTATDTVGVTAYLITNSATPPLANDAGWTATQPLTFNTGLPSPTVETAVNLYAWAKDAAGNVSAVFPSNSVLVTVP